MVDAIPVEGEAQEPTPGKAMGNGARGIDILTAMLVMSGMPTLHWDSGTAVPMFAAKAKVSKKMGSIESQYRDAGETRVELAVEERNLLNPITRVINEVLPEQLPDACLDQFMVPGERQALAHFRARQLRLELSCLDNIPEEDHTEECDDAHES